MSNRKLQEFDEYHYGLRGVLCLGDKFRVSGGPYYQNDDGTKTLMAERGTFVFRRYCEKGASKWIEATRVGGGNVVLSVSKGGPNPDLPSFKRRPYKVTKVTGRKGGKKQETGPAVDAGCAAKQKVGKGKDAGDKATTKVQARSKTGGAKGAKPRSKPKAKAGSTPARPGGGAKRGKNGGWGGAGRGKGSPSTSGSTSI
jgi:hypothetical protein